MNAENRRQNIADEIARGADALRAAEALLALSLHADAISRAYYAAFYYLRALLMSRGIEPKTHAGAISQFNVEFVRTGLLSSGHNRLIGGLQRARELADYDAAVCFSAEDAQAEIESASVFAAEALQLLEKEGWLS